MKKKPIIIGALIIFSIVFSIIIVNNYMTKTSFKYKNMQADEIKPEKNEQDAVNKAIYDDAAKEVAGENEKREIANEFPENDQTFSKLVNIIEGDLIYGNIDAPVTMIEYASLSCPHCAYFVYDAFPRLEEEYIKTGKVRFVYRDFPLNQQALVAGVIAKCHAKIKGKDDPTKAYFDILKTLFKSQDSWAFNKNYLTNLEAVSKIYGINSDEFKTCLEDKSYQEEILTHRMQAAKELVINSTPTFFINGVKSSGFTDYVKLKNIIESELTKARNSDSKN